MDSSFGHVVPRPPGAKAEPCLKLPHRKPAPSPPLAGQNDVAGAPPARGRMAHSLVEELLANDALHLSPEQKARMAAITSRQAAQAGGLRAQIEAGQYAASQELMATLTGNQQATLIERPHGLEPVGPPGA